MPSEINYDRCPNDDFESGTALVGVNPTTGEPIEVDMKGVASVVGIQAAMLTLSCAMKSGYEQDFLEKVALGLFGKLQGGDIHALCPLLTVCTMCLLLLRSQNEADVTFDEHGHLMIGEYGIACMFDGDNNDETDDGEPEPSLT